MTLTTAGLRFDKKCGKSAIPDKKKCSKPTRQPNVKRNIAIAAAAGGLLTVGGLMAYKQLNRPVSPSTNTTVKTFSSKQAPKALPQEALPTIKLKQQRIATAKAQFRKEVGAEPNVINEKHQYMMYKTKSSAIGFAITDQGNVVNLFMTKNWADEFEVGFKVNSHYAAKANYGPKETVSILSKVERMLQKALEGVNDEEIVVVKPYWGDNFGPKREKLYKRYGFQPADDDEEEMWAEVGDIKSKSRRNDALTPLTLRLDNKSPAWQRKEGKNPEGGLNAKGIASYRREHPGSKLSLAVTTDPSKLKPGSARAERRRRFCSRMSGMKRKLTSAKTANDPNSRINKSLRKWNCN